MKRVFVDSGGFFAFLARDDRFHEHARALFQRANAERWRLVTTNAVVIEAHALILTRSRSGWRNAVDFLDMIAADAYHVERIRRADEVRAMELIRAHVDKTYSLCDALSFVVMERLRIREAIATFASSAASSCSRPESNGQSVEDQGRVRSGQPVPGQSEHPAGGLSYSTGSSSNPAWRKCPSVVSACFNPSSRMIRNHAAEGYPEGSSTSTPSFGKRRSKEYTGSCAAWG